VNFRSVSLRGRFRWIVVGGAILPMALIGLWLAASTQRSAQDLLRAALDSTLVGMRADVADRWTYRQGDLELLRRNEAVVRTLQGPAPTATDLAYLASLKTSLAASFGAFVISDTAGHVRVDSDSLIVPKQSPARPGAPTRWTSLRVSRVVEGPSGAAIGTIEAWIPVSALLTANPAQSIFHAASLRVSDARNGAVLQTWTRPIASVGSTMERSMTLDDPPLKIEVAADDAPYVAPFEHAARIGLLSLVGVAIFALLLTAFLTSRVTESLETLVDAADAVAGGDLDRRVPVSGDDDIARLGHAFNAMTDGLRQTLHTVSRQQSLVAVGEFAARLSHEVRNALTSVRLDLQRLQERLPREGTNASLVDRPLASVDRLNRIVTGSLRIARADPESMQPVSLEGVARGALSSVEGAMRSARVQCDIEVRDELMVRGDAGALEQAIVNLLLNAVQAMPDGGDAALTLSRDDEWAKLSVTDAGGGISPATLSRLGEPFFSSKREGTGLGYSIARQIVVAHGGELRVARTGPKGTVIEMLLRLSHAPCHAYGLADVVTTTDVLRKAEDR
jgi:two-component system sensor histidine kinase HydH